MKRPATDGDEWRAAAEDPRASAGISSRRAAEAMIRAGRVSVNGQMVTELGTRANPHRDRITIDGQPLRAAAPPVYILLQQAGRRGDHARPIRRAGRRCAICCAGVRQRVFPVGRLDFHSAGLLLLTNDGELALRLTHPRYGVRKTYQVKVKGHPDADASSPPLAQGVRLADGHDRARRRARARAARERKTWLEITLAEGKNREVRRMCEAVGLPVEKLVRVALGPLKLGKLPPGAWRHLTDASSRSCAARWDGARGERRGVSWQTREGARTQGRGGAAENAEDRAIRAC